MVRELREIVRSRRGRAREPVFDPRELLQQQRPRLSVEALKDARLVQHERVVGHADEVVEALVVRDLVFGVARREHPRHIHAEDACFVLCLVGYGERGHNENATAWRAKLPRPLELHPRLAETTIREDCYSPLADCPSCYVDLEWVE